MTGYISRLLKPPRQSFFLLGPRGSGKSTWVRHELAEAHRIDLLDQAVYHAYLARPGQFADELRAVRPGTTVVVEGWIANLLRIHNDYSDLFDEW